MCWKCSQTRQECIMKYVLAVNLALSLRNSLKKMGTAPLKAVI